MNIIPIPAFTDNYIWAIIDQEIGVFDCVDPGQAQPVLQFAKEQHLELRSILLTHHHHDHIGGVDQLLYHTPNCIVYGPNDPRISYINHYVSEHQTIQVGKYSFRILFNPGHTSSHISYYEPQQGWLFCGDTLFSAGCGRVFDGTIEQLYHSMELFKSLPLETKVFCAHEYTMQNLRFAETVEPHNKFTKMYIHKLQTEMNSCSLPSTIEIELAMNPFLRTHSAEVQAFAYRHGALTGTPLDIFTTLREAKNNFK
ncbi:hydroxyacylglutathione hydrolase [Legionella saoudiensis]|uniref:hydroxyacylglutathione hydrolase n=1 Tax=Legionella saoudiensis TaxID=1750561 RepID=UPI000731B591|nr:hydroxyacylglutathione hydrolase [Legionella saoudiensis]